MWISRLAFDTLISERLKALEHARVLSDQNATLTVTMEWALRRVEQIERQNAQLLWKYIGIKVEVPVVVKPEPTDEDVIGGANMFQDMGNEYAKAHGIEWDEAGVVK